MTDQGAQFIKEDAVQLTLGLERTRREHIGFILNYIYLWKLELNLTVR